MKGLATPAFTTHGTSKGPACLVNVVDPTNAGLITGLATSAYTTLDAWKV